MEKCFLSDLRQRPDDVMMMNSMAYCVTVATLDNKKTSFLMVVISRNVAVVHFQSSAAEPQHQSWIPSLEAPCEGLLLLWLPLPPLMPPSLNSWEEESWCFILQCGFVLAFVDSVKP